MVVWEPERQAFGDELLAARKCTILRYGPVNLWGWIPGLNLLSLLLRNRPLIPLPASIGVRAAIYICYASGVALLFTGIIAFLLPTPENLFVLLGIWTLSLLCAYGEFHAEYPIVESLDLFSDGSAEVWKLELRYQIGTCRLLSISSGRKRVDLMILAEFCELKLGQIENRYITVKAFEFGIPCRDGGFVVDSMTGFVSTLCNEGTLLESRAPSKHIVLMGSPDGQARRE